MICTYYSCILSGADLKDKWQEGLLFFETYVFADWQFLIFFLMLLTIDTILTVYKAVTCGNISIKLVSIFLQKVLMYVCFLVLVHIVSHYTINGEKNSFFGWLNNVAYSALVVQESIFILESISSIRPELVPQWLLKLLKHYDKTGNFSKRPGKKLPNHH